MHANHEKISLSGIRHDIANELNKGTKMYTYSHKQLFSFSEIGCSMCGFHRPICLSWKCHKSIMYNAQIRISRFSHVSVCCLQIRALHRQNECRPERQHLLNAYVTTGSRMCPVHILFIFCWRRGEHALWNMCKSRRHIHRVYQYMVLQMLCFSAWKTSARIWYNMDVWYKKRWYFLIYSQTLLTQVKGFTSFPRATLKSVEAADGNAVELDDGALIRQVMIQF